MKRVTTFILAVICCVSFAASAQAPQKLFDVRNGNGIVDGGTPQPQAVYLVFKNAAAKDAVIDALCDTGNFTGLVRPPGETPQQLAIAKAQFAMAEIKNWLSGKVIEARQQAIERAKAKPDASDLP